MPAASLVYLLVSTFLLLGEVAPLQGASITRKEGTMSRRLLQSGLTEEQEFYSPSSEESLGATIIIALIQDDSIAIEVLLLDTLTTARGPEETLNALSMLNEYVEDQGCEDGPLRESFRNLYRDLQEQGRAVIIPSALRAADTIDVSALAECLMNASRDVDEERM